jgi:hypothetical protein
LHQIAPAKKIGPIGLADEEAGAKAAKMAGQIAGCFTLLVQVIFFPAFGPRIAWISRIWTSAL